jgi:hypothetical protein
VDILLILSSKIKIIYSGIMASILHEEVLFFEASLWKEKINILSFKNDYLLNIIKG